MKILNFLREVKQELDLISEFRGKILYPASPWETIEAEKRQQRRASQMKAEIEKADKAEKAAAGKAGCAERMPAGCQSTLKA